MDAPTSPPPAPPPPPPGSDLRLAVPPPPTGKQRRRPLKPDEQRAARLAVPYLGPLPAPAHKLGRALVAACAVGIVGRVLAAILLVQRSRIDDDLARGQDFALRHGLGLVAPEVPSPVDATALRVRLHENVDHLRALGTFNLATLVLILILLVVWGMYRRPRPTLAAFGETHVESSPLVAIPVVLTQVAMMVVILAAIASQLGRVRTGTPIHDLAGKRLWSASAQVGFALFWATRIVRVVFSERALGERVAASELHRAGLVPTDPVGAMPLGYQLGSALDPGPISEQPGPGLEVPRLGWMLRNTALGFVAVTCGGSALILIAAGGVGGLVGGAVCAVLLVGDIVAIVRLNRRAAAKAQAKSERRSVEAAAAAAATPAV